MSLQPRVDCIERLQFVGRKVATQRQRDVQPDRRVPLAQNEAIAFRPYRIGGVEAEEAEVQSREHIGGGQRTTEMSRARMMHRRENEPPNLARLLAELSDRSSCTVPRRSFVSLCRLLSVVCRHPLQLL